MNVGVDNHYNPAFGFTFDNGWSVLVAKMICGHTSVTVTPSWLQVEPAISEREFDANPDYWSKEAMAERGDFIAHFKGDDNELLAVILAVRLRDAEPYFKKIGQDIMKAVKA